MHGESENVMRVPVPNRPLSNFIETAALRYIEQEEIVDEFEMREIQENKSLSDSIEQGIADAKEKRGRYV